MRKTAMIDWRKRRQDKEKSLGVNNRENLENMVMAFRTRGHIPHSEIAMRFFQRKEYGSCRKDRLLDWMDAVKQEAYNQGFIIRERLIQGTRRREYYMEERDA